MPKEWEGLVGKVCVCSVGRPAIVTHRGNLTARDETSSGDKIIPAWMGIGLDGKGTRASTRPCVIAEDGKEFHNVLISRFGGKISFNI